MEAATISGIDQAAISATVSTIRTQVVSRIISSASSSPIAMVRVTQTAMNSTVRPTTYQNSLSARMAVYWSKPTHGGVLPDQSSRRPMSWKDMMTDLTSGKAYTAATAMIAGRIRR